MKNKNLAGSERKIQVGTLWHNADQVFYPGRLLPHVVLADPGLLARRLLKAAQQTRLVDMQQTAFEIDAEALAEHAFDTLLLKRRGCEAVRDAFGHDGAEGEGAREHQHGCRTEQVDLHKVIF